MFYIFMDMKLVDKDKIIDVVFKGLLFKHYLL